MKIIFGKGYDLEGDWVDAFLKYGLAKKKGGWYTIPSVPDAENIQGAPALITYLQEHPDVYTDLKEKARRAMLVTNAVPSLTPNGLAEEAGEDSKDADFLDIS
jgi:recombination protein RecA